MTNMTRRLFRKSLRLVMLLMTVCVCSGGKGTEHNFSLTTADRLEDVGWWPTNGDAPRTAYAGDTTCLQCHGNIAALQRTTPMYHAAVKASQSSLLAQRSPMSFHEGPFNYSLTHSSDVASQAVTGGGASSAALVTWAFGAGEIGQTYLLETSGEYKEGRLSYYTSLNGLDITTGQDTERPSDLEHAMGRPLSKATTTQCFSCHTTAAVIAGKFDPASATAGLGCEACHGPGAKHVAAMIAGHSDQSATTLTNPATLSPSDSVDFCGACHRTSADVSLLMPGNLGLASVRFQPYRLEKSRCWRKAGDTRITCVACHDPHQPLVHNLQAYDSKCLSCHLNAKRSPHGNVTAAACKVATSDCASCHMPKYNLPQTHARFTDHYIRVPKSDHFPS